MEKYNPLVGLWRLLKSKTLAAVMILVLTVVATTGMLRPDAGIFQTRWFAALGLVFLVNLLSCTIQQVVNSYRLWGKRNSLIKFENCVEDSTSADTQLTDIIRQEMGRRRYKQVMTWSNAQVWAKGRLGVWGAAVFHTGLIIITVGAMVSGTMKMAGHIKIAEGEVRYESHENYDEVAEGPYFNEGNHKGFGLTLVKQNITLDKNGDVDEIISDLGILENGRVVEMVHLGEKEPFIFRGLRIFKKEAGFAPFIDITGPGNIKVFNAYILLETKSSAEQKAEFYLNGLAVGDSGYTANIKFYPDMVRKGNSYSTVKYTLTNPAVVVTVYKGKEKIAEKAIKPGEFMEFAGYRLKMGGVRHWNAFDIVNDRGAMFVFAGSWVAIFGLAAMYLMPYKKIQITVEDHGKVKVIGITNRNRKPFVEELSEIESRLETVTG